MGPVKTQKNLIFFVEKSEILGGFYLQKKSLENKAKIYDRNGFNCVPAVRTYFLVLHETTMVSKVSQKNFEVNQKLLYFSLIFDKNNFEAKIAWKQGKNFWQKWL